MRGSEFAELRAFVTVAEHGNFARAAKALRISPSTLSQTIRELEERLGVRLLNRTTRSVSLTEAGGRLLVRFKPAMEEMVAAVADRLAPGRRAQRCAAGCRDRILERICPARSHRRGAAGAVAGGVLATLSGMAPLLSKATAYLRARAGVRGVFPAPLS